jgi:TolB protein
MIRHTKAFAFLFVASVLFASCTTSTSPSDNSGTSSLTGTLVYDLPSSDYELATYDFQTKRQAIILKDGIGPSWTPTGNVLFEEYDPVGTAFWKISEVAPNGTNKNVLLDSKMFSLSVTKSPKMSPNGKMVSFNYWFMDRTSDIYTGHATLIRLEDGSLLAVDSLFDGSWAPDNSLVLSATIDELYGEYTFYQDGLYRLAADGSSITSIGSGLVKPKHPAVSPDGTKIAFTMNQHIWMINSDGTGLRQVTTGSKEESHPCWSPDGKYIACISFGTFEVSYYTAIAAVPSTNSAAIDLTNDSPYWVRDPSVTSGDSRLNPSKSISWR